jgi:hypothetical protein
MKRLSFLLLLSCVLSNNTIAKPFFNVSSNVPNNDNKILILGGFTLVAASFIGYNCYAVRRDADKVPTQDLTLKYQNLLLGNTTAAVTLCQEIEQSDNKKEFIYKALEKANKPYNYSKTIYVGHGDSYYDPMTKTYVSNLHSETVHYISETAIFAGYVQFVEQTIKDINDSFWYIDRRLSQLKKDGNDSQTLHILKKELVDAIPLLNKLIQHIKQHPQYNTDLLYPYAHCTNERDLYNTFDYMP